MTIRKKAKSKSETAKDARAAIPQVETQVDEVTAVIETKTVAQPEEQPAPAKQDIQDVQEETMEQASTTSNVDMRRSVKEAPHQLTLRVSESLRKKFTAKAAEEGLNLNDFGQMLLDEGLTRRAWDVIEGSGFQGDAVNHREQQKLQHKAAQQQGQGPSPGPSGGGFGSSGSSQGQGQGQGQGYGHGGGGQHSGQSRNNNNNRHRGRHRHGRRHGGGGGGGGQPRYDNQQSGPSNQASGGGQGGGGNAAPASPENKRQDSGDGNQGE